MPEGEIFPPNPVGKSFKSRFVNVAKDTAKAMVTDVLTPAENTEINKEFNGLAEIATTNTEIKTPFLWPYEHLDEMRAKGKTATPSKNLHLDTALWLKKALFTWGSKRSEEYMRRANGSEI